MLPDKVRTLEVDIAGQHGGQLVRDSQYVFTYRRDDPAQSSVGLLMPSTRLAYQDTALFPVMDQNLPEGYLYQRIRAEFPKRALTPMHLLALMGSNGIGRLGFRLPEAPPAQQPRVIDRAQILAAPAGAQLFEDLVHAYLSTGAGLAGIQPKIMVPDRATWPVPNLIVKMGSDAYPGIAANEFLCLSAARRAGIEVPGFELSHSGELLVLERFDVLEDGRRLGFEDIAALMGLQVHGIHDGERKYVRSYQAVAEVLNAINLPRSDLARFYEQVALTVMVRNGDGHLKNYGVLYDEAVGARLAPMFDVVTTSIYKYSHSFNGPPQEDHTLALKFFRGHHASKAYPTTQELLRFGTDVCGVRKPGDVVQRIAQAMHETLVLAKQDERIPHDTLEKMGEAWRHGLAYAAAP
ncbi:type II toxin-antitoxin system HipA family toxin [Ramlibacter sp. WS9]|uniref:type II toxin-antitoxin system HipA family toxin n=1 Tax=Ramlibacter sp. WS9 TaxID=1882741 RepID=UPI0011437022|nr:type II toxin-antitoxin system HipA family toxin [Ramlibacter sp. WS9]ROZ69413.1 type II toxin-antitoxin system HipA family toxin [Ramlibacter sp. WS9]